MEARLEKRDEQTNPTLDFSRHIKYGRTLGDNRTASAERGKAALLQLHKTLDCGWDIVLWFELSKFRRPRVPWPLLFEVD